MPYNASGPEERSQGGVKGLTQFSEEGGGSRIFARQNGGVAPTILENHLKICWWTKVHTPIIVDLEALNKIKSTPFI
jgi:hypothetical protein